jgi:tetraacyldisaccharide 4'-kinase
LVRAGIEKWLNKVWYERANAPIALRALEPVYRRVAAFRAARHRRRQPADLVGMPIIVVGNITVGGTGKTPLVIRLCELIRHAGFRPGVISRGYGAVKKETRSVHANSDPAVYGDEPVLIARRARADVVVSSDRVAAARKLFRKGAQVLIADDGLQHHRLPRSMEICVIDLQRQVGNGRQLPAGPLRESADRLQSVDYVILNGVGEAPPDTGEAVRMTLSPVALRPLNGRHAIKVRQLGERLEGVEIHAFAGIGNPRRFFDQLEQMGIDAIDHPMPDHHAYGQADFDGISSCAMIIMTEKDAVKCLSLKLPNAWYMPVKSVLPASWEQEFAAQVTAMVLPEADQDDSEA